MKNREKFAKEIFDIACKGSRIAIKHDCVIPCVCSKIECSDCQFDFYDDCEEGIENWCESEYVEKHTITSREKMFLDLILTKWKYIARDEDDELYVYNVMISKGMNCWYITDIERERERSYCKISMNLFGNMFDFIKWKDEKPWSIEDLKKLEVRE